jgi:hypothetical protein
MRLTDGRASGERARIAMPALIECAAVAGALLAPHLLAWSVEALGSARIEAIIAGRTFVPVFQPIVELETRATIPKRRWSASSTPRSHCNAAQR